MIKNKCLKGGTKYMDKKVMAVVVTYNRKELLKETSFLYVWKLLCVQGHFKSQWEKEIEMLSGKRTGYRLIHSFLVGSLPIHSHMQWQKNTDTCKNL